ncbi:MAG: hypothetical protein EBU90_11990 [Proteobacteria bacterium]|nr:hypothetical protein [Pseudomonadota bacterium]NBP14832.1 hypothetical protein [bacterium]
MPIVDTKLVKTAHVAQKYTEDQINDLLQCADQKNGPHFFLNNFFYIQHPVKGRLLYQAYEYQVRLVDSYHNHRFNINLLPRQTGKTTTAAGYLLWYAMFNPDSTILVAAHKYTGAQEIMHKIRTAYELCPDHIRGGVVSYNKQSIEFDNGSRIVAQTTTETTGRGMSISLLYADEFAFVEPNIATEFWTSIRPTLATGGKAILTSTPNSDEDQFAMIWKEANFRFDEFGNSTEVGRNEFFPFKAHWSEHPERDEKWASVERASIGEERFRREHECEFLVFDETLVSSICLAELEGIEPYMRMGQCRWYKKVNPKMTYIVAMDPSLGTGGDPAAIQVLEIPTFRQVAEWSHNLTTIQAQVRILRDICNYISEKFTAKGVTPSLYYSVENNAVGEAAIVAIDEIGEDSIPGLFLSEPLKKGHVRRFRRGFNTTHSSKISTCAKLKHLIESKRLELNSKQLISELKTFVAKGISFEGKQGSTDDLVSSLLLAVRMTVMLQEWDPAIYDKLREERDDEFVMPMPIYISNY